MWPFRRNPSPKPLSNYYDGLFLEFVREDALSMSFERSPFGFVVPQEQVALKIRMRQFQIDLRWMRHLYDKVIVPQVEKFGFTKFKTAERSEFVSRIDLDHERHGDSHDILRLGYVHLYHKFEAYRNDIIELLDVAFHVSGADGIVKTMDKLYGIDICRGPMGEPKLREIAYIAGSAKHTDGKPKSNGSIPPRFAEHAQGERIKVFEFELLRDIDAMELIGARFFHVLATVHHRRRLTTDSKHPKYDSLTTEGREKFDLDLKMRTGQATYLVKEFFTELPDHMKWKWPDITGAYPLPEEEMKRWTELSNKLGSF